jgi:hypothetical protein
MARRCAPVPTSLVIGLQASQDTVESIPLDQIDGQRSCSRFSKLAPSYGRSSGEFVFFTVLGLRAVLSSGNPSEA